MVLGTGVSEYLTLSLLALIQVWLFGWVAPATSLEKYVGILLYISALGLKINR